MKGERYHAAAYLMAATLIVLGILGMPAAGQDRETLELSLLLAAKRASESAIAKLPDQDPAPFTERARELMLKDVKGNRTLEQGKGNVTTQIDKQLDSQVEAIVRNVVRNLGVEQHGFEAAKFQNAAEQRVLPAAENAKEKFLKERADAVFTNARRQAEKHQRDLLKKSAYPTQAQANEIDQNGWSSPIEVEVRGLITEKVPVLFESNKSEPGKILEEIKRHVKEQRASQRAAVVDASVNDLALSEAAISRVLESAVEQRITELRTTAAKGQQVYSVFPSVRSGIAERAVKLERDRWLDFLSEFERPFEVDDFTGAISAHPDRHKAFVDSQAQFIEAKAAQLAADARADYAVRLPSMSERDGFVHRLESRYADDAAVREAIAKAVARSIDRDLRDARVEVTEVQLHRHFQSVASGKWSVPEPTLLKDDRDRLNLHKFEQVTRLPRITEGSESYRRSMLLDDAEKAVVNRVAKLLSEGRTAWEAQKQLVEELVADVEEELAVVPDLATVSKQELIDKYTERTRNKWADTRVSAIWRGFSSPPPYADIKYFDLFGKSKETIGEKVHKFFDAEVVRRTRPEPEIEQPPQPAPAPAPVPEPEPQSPSGAEPVDQGTASPPQAVETPPTKEFSSATDPASSDSTEGASSESAESGTGTGAAARGGQANVDRAGPKAKPGGMRPWMNWWLLLLLAILLLVIVLLLYKISRLRSRQVALKVPDIQVAATWLEQGLNLKPIKREENKLIYQLDRDTQMKIVQAGPA